MIRVIRLSILFFLLCSCNNSPKYYSASDFDKVPKVDSHFHYDTNDSSFMKYAISLNFKLVSPMVDAGMPINDQFGIARNIKMAYPDKFAFLGTFSVDSFNTIDFTEKTINHIDMCVKAGASGIKIWKNIGMDIKDTDGKLVMAYNPKFTPVFQYLETNKIPLLAHLGEPKNCWLPLEKMTLDNDVRYFKENPKYHMCLHPEAPSYEDQINARDSILKKYPNINFIGAHLGSMEWSVDMVAQYFESFPSFNVDMAARIGHLQYQSSIDREKVRDFMIKYQDRILYATDIVLIETKSNKDFEDFEKTTTRTWFNQWLYLATDTIIAVDDLGGKKVKGLKLPSAVIDKIYYKNAQKIYFNN